MSETVDQRAILAVRTAERTVMCSRELARNRGVIMTLGRVGYGRPGKIARREKPEM